MDGDETKEKLPEAETAASAVAKQQPVDALVHDAVQRILASITPVAVLAPVAEAAPIARAADPAADVTEDRPEVEAAPAVPTHEPVAEVPVASPSELEPVAGGAVDGGPDAVIASHEAGAADVTDVAAEKAADGETSKASAAPEEIAPVIELATAEQPPVAPSEHVMKEAEEPVVLHDAAAADLAAAARAGKGAAPAPLIADRAIDPPPPTKRSLRDRLRGPWTIGRVARLAGLAVAAYFGAVMLLILLYRFINPPTTTLIAYQWLTGTKIEQTWVPIEDISGNLLRAVVVSEDWGFCDHYGVDLVAIEKALEQAGEGKIARGASTISMQVIKNLFLSQSKSYLRKAVEIPLTIVAEAVWPKSRMLEIYLNIAEWGPGVFGAEAAAQHHFSKPASQLTSREAALLAAALPNPILRDAGDPGTRTARKASVIQARMRAAGPVADCAMTGRQRSSETGRDDERAPGDGWRTTVKKRAGAGEGL